MRHLVSAALLVGLAALVLLPGSCSSASDSSPVAGGAGAAGSGSSAGSGGSSGSGAAGASGAAGETFAGWEPIEGWTGQLPLLDNPLPDLDCGPGCRLALQAPVSNRSYFDQGADAQGVYDTDNRSLFFASYDSSSTRVLSPPLSATVGYNLPFRWGRYLAFVSYKLPDGRVHVWDTQLGLQRTFAHVTQLKGTNVGPIVRVAVNDRFVFWIQDGVGIFRADLQTGETRRLTPAVPLCRRFCGLANGLICATSQVFFVDQETGDSHLLDASNHLQLEGACSNDLTQVAWIDYRDPPGPSGNLDALRGGEVYVHDLATSKTRRVTFDSPSTPRLKRTPFVDGDWVVWTEMPADKPQAPETTTEFYGGADRLVRLNMTTGQKCRLEGWGGADVTLRNHHLQRQWVDRSGKDPTQRRYLVDLDLDHPDLPWACDPLPTP